MFFCAVELSGASQRKNHPMRHKFDRFFHKKVFNAPFVDKAPPQVYTDNISYTDRS